MCVEAEPPFQKGSLEADAFFTHVSGTEKWGLTLTSQGAAAWPERLRISRHRYLLGTENHGNMVTQRAREGAGVQAAPVHASPQACPCF